MARLKDKVAIVTGATSGIGRETAITFAREGAKVIATGRNTHEGRKTEAEAKAAAQAGGDCVYHYQDIQREDEWREIVAGALKHWGKLDILVNNAGVFWVKPIAETTLAEFDEIYRINVEGAWLGMKAAMAVMEGAGGSIVNVSSLMGLVGYPGATAYCASKGAVTLMTKSAALEGAPRNIRVNSLHPGVIWTNMLTGSMGDNEELKQFFINETPLRMMGYPRHMADAILFLASDEASFVTGSELTVDGGRGAD